MAHSRAEVKLQDHMADGVTPRCKETVQDRDMQFPHYHQCSFSGKVETADGWRCNRHSPEEVARRARESEARESKQWNQRRKEIHGPRFLAVLEQIAAGHNDPRTLAQKTIDDFREGDRCGTR